MYTYALIVIFLQWTYGGSDLSEDPELESIIKKWVLTDDSNMLLI